MRRARAHKHTHIRTHARAHARARAFAANQLHVRVRPLACLRKGLPPTCASGRSMPVSASTERRKCAKEGHASPPADGSGAAPYLSEESRRRAAREPLESRQRAVTEPVREPSESRRRAVERAVGEPSESRLRAV
jgi:hypothetical protein